MKIRKRIIIVCLIGALLVSCAHQIEIVDHEVKAGKMKAGQAYIAPMDGWYISQDGITGILTALEYYRLRWIECEERYGPGHTGSVF